MVNSFIRQNVAGMFFAPLELSPDKDAANRKIARDLERAKIPVVLLDRCYLPYPERSAHDWWSDNRRAGYMAAAHLLSLAYGVWHFWRSTRSQHCRRAHHGLNEALRKYQVTSEQDPVCGKSAG